MTSSTELTPAETETHLGGSHRTFKFENGYGASVVSNLYSYGGKQGLFELAVLDEDGELTYDTPITNDVIGYLTEEDVQQLLQKVAAL